MEVNWPMAITAPITWLAMEYLRAEIMFGAWPWYLAGLPLVNWPVLVQVADLGGVWMASLLVVCIGAALAEWMRPRPRVRRAWISTVVAGVFLLFTITYGLVRLSAPEGPVLGRVLLVQTNLPLDNKLGWSFENQLEDVGGFMDLTASGLSDAGGADLVVWPEAMLPGIGFNQDISRALDDRGEMGEWLRFWPRRMRAFVEGVGTPVLTGTDTWSGELETRGEDESRWLASTIRYNSATLLDDGPVQSYHKVFPTPFGERLPWIDAWPWLREKLLDLGARGMVLNLDPGPEPVLLELDGPGDGSLLMSTPICFEATIPSVTRDLARPAGATRVADVLVNLTNDGWLGDVDGARVAHAQAARFRTIELRRPMLRCVNTGQTAWYDSSGREVASLPMREPGCLLAEPRADSRRTLYGLIGNLVPMICLALAALLFLLTFLRPRST